LLERATNIAAAYVDHDAHIRFYRVLPTELRRMQATKSYSPDFLDPVVEISMSTAMLGALWQRLDQLVPAEEGTS
jgi:hypothetical protein